MIRKSRAIVLVALIALTSCSTQRLVLRQDFTSNTLRVSLIFAPEVPDEITYELENRFQDFVLKNNATNKLKLESVSGQQISDLQIRVLSSALVTPQQQTAGVFVSMLGLSLPFLMASAEADFVIFFWYFPKAHSILEMSLDPAVNGSAVNPIHFNLQSPGFLKKPEIQVKRHGDYFANYLQNVIKGLKKR